MKEASNPMRRHSALGRWWKPAAMTLVCLMLLLVPVACGGGGGTGPAGTGETGNKEVTSTMAVSPTSGAAAEAVKNPDTFVSVGTQDFIDSLDPAYVYDTGSGTIL